MKRTIEEWQKIVNELEWRGQILLWELRVALLSCPPEIRKRYAVFGEGHLIVGNISDGNHGGGSGGGSSGKGIDKSGESCIIKGRGNGTHSSSKMKQSVRKVGAMDPNDHEAIISTLEHFEEKYRNKFREYALVITSQGDIYFCRGDEGTVNTTILLGKEKMRGSWNTHNHPPGTGEYTFSKEDIFSFCDDGSYCMRATDSVFTYELTRSNKMPTQRQIMNVYSDYYSNRWILLDKAGKTMFDTAYDEMNIVVENVALKFGMKYRRWGNDEK